MLRPEQMSRVSVTGSKRVLDEVIETIHDLRLLHVTEYDESWEGFEPGDPMEGADDASEKLVTVRSLESILDIDEEDAGPSNRLVTDEAVEDRLEEIRLDVNELDDRRDEVRDELRSVEERIDGMEPFVRLGIDLDLLGGYDTLSVEVGEGDAESVRRVLAESDIAGYQVFQNEGAIGVFARADTADLQETLVDATFTALEIPDGEGDPTEYLEELRHRKQQLESRLTTVEDEIEDLKLEVAGFLLAAEEKLAIDVQKREAPLTFATTENAFVAEGWIPSERYVDVIEALESAVGEHVEIQELERASYDQDGHVHGHEPVEQEESPGSPAAADGGDEDVAADGGTVTTGQDEPPVVQKNTAPAKPFELLTRVIGRPLYWEFDPTFILLLTFPLMFGFMIGDFGYGILYILVGLGLMRTMDSDGWRALGGIAVWSGVFTAIFGVLYGEVFGLHQLGEIVWGGNPPIHKGLQPTFSDYAELWLVVSLLFGLAHLTLGYLFGFIKELSHGIKAAVLEKGSWTLLMLGVWVWIFSASGAGKKPDFLVGAGSVFNGNPFPFAFEGFTATVGLAGLAIGVVGFVLLVAAEGGVAIPESLNVLVNVLSYTRIAAVLLAKAGMAFVVNLLFFGVFATGHGEDISWHFALTHMPDVGTMYHGHEVTSQVFPGLYHMGAIGIVAGLVVLVAGHALVLALGVTSAGLQAVRLEYVEFFSKFYEGGGEEYSPFGYERQFTAEE